MKPGNRTLAYDTPSASGFRDETVFPASTIRTFSVRTTIVLLLFLSKLQGAAFEAAAIKVTPPDWNGGRYITMQSAHLFAARNHTLKTLIAAAYNLNPKAIGGGPEWIDSVHYDVFATTPGELRPGSEEQMTMLRALLAERFGLRFHRENREMPVYSLSTAAGGPKLKIAAEPEEPGTKGLRPLAFVVDLPVIRLPARGATIADFISILQRAALDRPVADRTGLTGRYDFDLAWTPDDSQFGGAFGSPVNAAPDAPPGLFTALQQQLGLKLTPLRAEVSTLVVDRLERPSEN